MRSTWTQGLFWKKGTCILCRCWKDYAYPNVRGRANPKSSTGRLDIFTRLITDVNVGLRRSTCGIPRGPLYLEIVPRSFTIRVQTGLALNQLRLTDRESQVHTRNFALYTVKKICFMITMILIAVMPFDLAKNPRGQRTIFGN